MQNPLSSLVLLSLTRCLRKCGVWICLLAPAGGAMPGERCSLTWARPSLRRSSSHICLGPEYWDQTRGRRHPHPALQQKHTPTTVTGWPSSGHNVPALVAPLATNLLLIQAQLKHFLRSREHLCPSAHQTEEVGSTLLGCLPCFSASVLTGCRFLSSRCLKRSCSTSSCCSPATSMASMLRSERAAEHVVTNATNLRSRFSATAALRTDTRHVWEDDVDVDFQFVSSGRVDVQLRMNLWDTYLGDMTNTANANN